MRPLALTPRQVQRRFEALLAAGTVLRVAGRARTRPRRLLALHPPRYELALFDTRFFLAAVRQNPYVRFFVAYVVQERPGRAGSDAWARLFYKDGSLIWRSASHVGRQQGAFWLGKGDVRTVVQGGEEYVWSMESTTDLPVELQPAIEALSRRSRRIPRDDTAPELVLRRAPDGRIEPYHDFVAPRRRAQSNPRNLVNGGRPVAWFTRPGDPGSLRFAAGYEPDLRAGLIGEDVFTSRLYGGEIRRFRILSHNRRIQYLFMAAPRHVWIIPPQATTTELSSYGVRTVDVVADDDLFVPGFEYHFLDDTRDPPVLYSQIPAGWAGAGSPVDEARADASAWCDALPVVQAFRRQVLGRVPASRRRA